MLLTESEWKIMHCLWRRHPASVRDVLEEVHEETGWAYTTVKTMMDRLAAKGALEVEKRANTVFYRPLLSRSEARRSAVGALLDRAFEGSLAPFLGFLAEERLSAKDRRRLERILEEAEGKERHDG